MTVVLIAVAGLFLAGIARQSLTLALDAHESQEALQRRWGELSCRQAILLHADAILKQQQRPAKENDADGAIGAARASAHLVLGGLTFDLLLADESAKISLNVIYRRQGDESVTGLISESSQSSGVLPVRLRPYRSNSETTNSLAFDSWGQVFSLDRVEGPTPASELLEAATTEMTCWGDGKLNLERATDDNVERISRLAVGDTVVSQLLELRKQCLAKKKAWQLAAQTAATTKAEAAAAAAAAKQSWLPGLLGALQLRATERRRLDETLADRSTSYSLWTTIRTTGRSWQQFSILDTSTESQPKCCSYCW